MLQMYLHLKRPAFIAALCLSVFALNGCVESTFNLAADSRLPQWFTLPSGLTRADVTVTMHYYTVGQPKFILQDNNGKKIAMITGREERSKSGLAPAYLDYQVITANGLTEIIKLKPYKAHENMVQNGNIVALFYVIDDPAVRKEQLASRAMH